MQDAFFTPTSHSTAPYYQEYYACGNNWQRWEKPNGISMVYVVACGAGAGGGGGFFSTLYTGFAGLGGGSSAITKMLIPAYLVPDSLYILVPPGGIGGAGSTVPNVSAGAVGGAGNPAYISNGLVGGDTNYDVLTSTTNLFFSSGGIATGGPGGLSATAGFGGNGATANNTNGFYATKASIWQSFAGATGSSDASPNVTLFYTGGVPFTGGASGGASATNGGSVVGTSFMTPISGGIGSTTVNASNGGNGVFTRTPFASVGGAGGGSGLFAAGSGNGGNGGNGGIGSGGGGGGALQASTGIGKSGSGGNGGDGLVIIVCW